MIQPQFLQRLVVFAFAFLFLTPLSLFAEDRPDWRTNRVRSNVNDRRGDSDVRGVVVSVNPNGDEFLLRTGRRTIRIDARGGVSTHYRGRRYRIRDLERGDRVAVDLVSTSFGYRARSVEVLDSASHRGRYDRYDVDARGSHDRLSGWVVSVDSDQGLMIVRTNSSRELAVNMRQLGNNSIRSIRAGDRVELAGSYDGRTFVAESIRLSNSGEDWRNGRRRR